MMKVEACPESTGGVSAGVVRAPLAPVTGTKRDRLEHCGTNKAKGKLTMTTFETQSFLAQGIEPKLLEVEGLPESLESAPWKTR